VDVVHYLCRNNYNFPNHCNLDNVNVALKFIFDIPDVSRITMSSHVLCLVGTRKFVESKNSK